MNAPGAPRTYRPAKHPESFEDFIGREIRVQRPATPEERAYWGTPDMGGQDVLRQVQRDPNGIRTTLVFDEGWSYIVEPFDDTTVWVVESAEEQT